MAEKVIPWFVAHNRRTHSVHYSHYEAERAGRDLALLLNGIPVGYRFAIEKRLGKYALVSFSSTPLEQQQCTF